MSLRIKYYTVWRNLPKVCKRRPQDVGKGCTLPFHIGQYEDVLRTSYFNALRTSVEDVLRTSVGDVPWRYVEDHIGTSIERLLGTSSGRPRDVILLSGYLWLFNLFLNSQEINFTFEYTKILGIKHFITPTKKMAHKIIKWLHIFQI